MEADHDIADRQSLHRQRAALVPDACRTALTMNGQTLYAAALTQLLLHRESGCRHAALHAASLLQRLGEAHDADAEWSALCERASQRLIEDVEGGTPHARAA